MNTSEDNLLNDNSVASTKPTAEPTSQAMHTDIANLRNLVPPGASPEEFLDVLANVPQEQLIPWEETSLPSRGIYYGWPDGTCHVRAMGQTAEKILATQRLASSGQSIDYLFRECCKFPAGFDAADLLLGDRVFLLYYLRGITHGNMYEFAVTCNNPECGAVSTHAYDLNDLVTTMRVADQSLGGEPFKITLPYLTEATGREVWVGVRFLRAYDANEMLARRRVRNKAFSKPAGGVRAKTKPMVDPRAKQQEAIMLDSTLDDNLEKIIVSVMGVADRLRVRTFVQKLHAQDTAEIRDWLRNNTPGIDTTIDIECPECKSVFQMELPITESFFRPTKQRGTG